MMDILSWIEKVQKWDMSAYLGAYRARVFSGRIGPEQTNQNTQRHKMPKCYEAYNDKVYMCHEWTGIRSGLAPMDSASEKDLVTELLEKIASTFKWNWMPSRISVGILTTDALSPPTKLARRRM